MMKTIQVTLEETIHARAKAAALAAHMTLGDLVRLALSEKVCRLEGAPQADLTRQGGAQ